MVCDGIVHVALFVSVVVPKFAARGGKSSVMIEVLKGPLKISRRAPANNLKRIASLNRSNNSDDFRAVEIAPSVKCCAAATQATGRRYLLRAAPRLPLMGCRMPTRCSCKFLKNADRGDRRLYGGSETNRWFGGRESRKGEARRSAEE
jgi:hypothetical protein